MSSTDNLPRPADSPCLKCASAGCTSITIGKGDNRKTFPGCATWQQWFSERWQGYQDRWTDIGEWVDTKGKKHKPADGPRYKALGNSIALPQWNWIAQKMRPYMGDSAKLGSLFDGIGGFPLVWEATYGTGTARWASEIEEFPIAVTKLRFPEKEAKE